MSLLSVTVKTARFVGPQASQWNSYVTLKLQHVKSTTAQVKGANPCWGQDFLFEINNLDAGLLIEVWASGRMWDNSVGYHWLHLKDIQHANWVIHGTGKWLSLDAELVMRDGQVVGTKTPTGHELLVDARFELPYGKGSTRKRTSEVEVDDAVDLQRKLEMYNSMLDEETRAEQARKQHQYYIQCESGVSEDSDYTSDINYPVGQHPNSSASQFLSAANQLTTPQRSLTSSRENSYEKDDDYRTGGGTHDPYQPPPYSTGHRKQLPTVPPHPSNHRSHGQSSTGRTSHRKGSNSSYWEEQGETATEGDPLYYNSRPQSNYRPYSSPSYRGRGDSWGDDGYSKGDQTLRQYSDGYDDAQDYSQSSRTYSKRHKGSSRRGTASLERQYTMYHGHDDHYGDYYSQEPTDQNGQTKQTSRYHTADSYSSSTYQQQNLYNAQKNSVYDEYSDQYGDYGSAGTICNDYSIASVDGSALNQQNYANDTSYSDYGWGGEENSLRDQYNRTNAAAAAASSKRSGKELPQLPVPQSSQSQQVSPYASQSTVKEVSVSSMNVPSIIATQYEDPIVASTSATIPTTSTHDRLVNSHDYISDLSTSVADESFYDAVSNTTSAYDNYSTAGVITSTTTASYGVSKAVTSVVDSTSVSQHQDPQQYSYENQVGYEDWQNYGYYDASGQYIAYDQTGYYDDQATITEETVGSVGIVDTTSTVSTTAVASTTATATTLAQQPHSESIQYSTKDQYDPYSSSVTTTAPTTTSAALSGSLQTTEVQVHSHQEDSYGQYDNTDYYDAEGEMMQVDYAGYEGTEYGMEYAGDSYGYTDTAYDQTSIEPSQNLNDKTNLNSKSNIEYNYAYQSAENLPSSVAAFDNGYSSTTLDRSNSVSRRASFKRQTSTRDYGYSETMDSASVNSQQYPPHSSARNSLTPATVAGANSLPPSSTTVTTTATTTSSHSASHPINSGAAAVGAAANAATKLTSEIKSALPQLTSLTKAKTGGLFSSGFSKFGSFVTNAAEKTGVPIPPVIKDAAAAAAAATGVTANKDVEKTNVETVQINQQQQIVANHVDNMTHGKSSIQPGISFEDQLPYDGEVWDDAQQIPIDHHRPPHTNHYNDAYDQYEGTEEGPESYASGPVHMDSLESNVSEGGGKDPESTIEAQYWQKQKERIAKQNSMAAVDADGFYEPFDPYDNHKGVFQASVDSPVPQNGDQGRSFSKEEYEKQHSLDRDEWLGELARQSGGVARPGVLKRGETSEMGMSFDRDDSLDQRHPDDYGDEYMDELPRSAKGSIDASGGYPIEPLHKGDALLGRDVDRKTSLEMAPEKEKGSKSVSFEEEPPKAIPPQSQIQGMTPREKWLWAINRIQLAVSK